MSDVAATVHETLDRLAGDMKSVGIAVSGGGDSMALLHLVAGWAHGRRVMVATVDHGLRPEARDEARIVAEAAIRLGMAHRLLVWHDHDAPGNLQANARFARQELLSGWALDNDLDAVMVAHTRDDQAETLLLRLLRGSGVDGLAAMAERRLVNGVVWLRPMLEIGREALRGYLRREGIAWAEDPSNDDPRFDRVRVRQAMRALDLSHECLAMSAQNMAMAQEALASHAADTAAGAEAANGSLGLRWPVFSCAPAEIRRRLLVTGVMFVTGAPYPPRRAAVLHALRALQSGRRTTLDGAMIEAVADDLRFIREPAAALRAQPATAHDPVWDRRWRIGGLGPDHQVRAIGFEGLARLPWRPSGLGRNEAAASPGIFRGDDLVAAPLLRSHASFEAKPLRRLADFRDALRQHSTG